MGKQKFTKIGIALRPGVPEALHLASEIISWARSAELAVYHDQFLHEVVNSSTGSDAKPEASGSRFLTHTCRDVKELVSSSDIIVTLGGDGTLIRIARCAEGPGPLMVGVNFGTLGFLTEIRPAEALQVLKKVIEGKFLVAERAMLRVRVLRDGKEVFSGQSINDAVIQKASQDKLVSLDIRVAEEEVMRLKADGLILATPTGSTAYSLAAGGSIVYPSLNALLVTPICPHSLTVRPFIVPLQTKLEVQVPEYEGEVFLTLDGQDNFPLQVGDLVRTEPSETSIRFVRSPHKSYFEILRTKLNWGIANKND